MAMRQYGYVTELTDDTAKIRVDRQSACGGSCGSCGGCPQNAVFVYQKNDPDHPFYVGERVVLVMPFRSFFLGLLQSYGYLALTLFAGAVLGYRLGHTEGSGVLGGFFGLLLGGVTMYLMHKKNKPTVRVIRDDTKGNAQ